MTVPKLESHLEARLWNDVFTFAQQELGVDHGTIKATVLIETFPAAFEMEEILYELRDHSAGLNAGRWDYIFSVIKSFRERPEFVFPDRAMAALIPSRRDPEANERALSTPGDVIEEGIVAYIDSWLNGNGAAAINNLMEDAGTAEISPLAGGGRVTPELVRELAGDASGPAYELFEATALDDELPELLTLPAYERLEG